jgi:SAM-dependent methyltransferase
MSVHRSAAGQEFGDRRRDRSTKKGDHPLAHEQRSKRHQRILGLFDQSRGRGLEIGPLFDPVVRRWDGDIRYVDVHPGALLKEFYATHPGVPVDDIVDPDFVLIGPDGSRTLPEAVQGAEPFDWVIASHVIEHVPDILGWLSEVAEILVDDGQLILAVPDRRFSFDAARAPTTVGEILLAHHNRDQVPSVRAIYDHYHGVVSINAADAWRGHEPGVNERIHDLDFVRSQLDRAVNDGVYVDCHVWLFTPQSFVDQLAELARLDGIAFVVDKIMPTALDELEFYAVLRRLPRRLDAEQRATRLFMGLAHTGLDDTGFRPPEPAFLASDAVTLSARELRLLHAKRSLMERIRNFEAKIRRIGRGTH